MFKQKSEPPPGGVHVEPADAVQLARARARHRLIGAIVLLVIGIIGFPLVFETEPRPVPIDIPIEIPRRDTMPPLPVPASRAPVVAPVVAPVAAPPVTPAIAPVRAPVVEAPSPGPSAGAGIITESSTEAGRDITPPRAAASAAVVAVARAPSAAASSRPSPATASAAASRPAADDGARALALLEGRGASAPASTRFVVQIGAFADAESAQKVRRQAERLGLKTYTQVATTSAGSRIRVRLGPFAARAEADAAQAKARAAGIAADVLAL